jgi:hypothetical protein
MIRITREAQTQVFEHAAFGCCSECDILCQVLFCCPCASGELWAAVRGEECTVCHSDCRACYGLMWARAKIRDARDMSPSLVEDCCFSVWCSPCATCQVMNELKQLGHFTQQPEPGAQENNDPVIPSLPIRR